MEQLGLCISSGELSDGMPRSGDFASLGELGTAARRYQLATRAIQWTYDIPSAAPPAIIAIAVPGNRLHFIAVLESRGGQVLVRDGPERAWMFTADLRRRGWDGVALHVARGDSDLTALDPSRWNRERWIFGVAAGLFTATGVIFCRPGRRGALR